MAVLLKIEGIEGSSDEKGYEGWIEADSMQFGAGRAISLPQNGGVREASRPSISEVTIMKSSDASSSALFQEVCGGQSRRVTIVVLTKGIVDLELLISDVMVSGYSMSSGGERPSESVSFNFTKIEMKTGGRATTYDLMRDDAA